MRSFAVLGTAIAAAVLACLLTRTQTLNPGVLLSDYEWWSLLAPIFPGALVAGAALGLLAGKERAAQLGVVALPALTLVLLSWMPVRGRLYISMHFGWVVLAMVLIACLVLGLRSRFRPALAVLCWLLLAPNAWSALQGVNAGDPAPQGRPMVLITLDTVRCDQFDFCGSKGPFAHTPALSSFAQSATSFTEVYAPAALTGPSHGTMFSGMDVLEHGVRANGRSLGSEVPWLPELLAGAGWATAGFVSAAVLDVSLGFGRGFEQFDSTREQRLARGHPFFGALGFRKRAGSAHHREGWQTLALAKAALRRRGRSFTWIHLYDAHWPYHPSDDASLRQGLAPGSRLNPKEFMRLPMMHRKPVPESTVVKGQTLYRAGIEDLDRVVGAILDIVPEEAVVVVVGDHGESLGEHEYYFTHGRLPYAPDTHVPLLIRVPGKAPSQHDAVVSLKDLAPTMAALAGLSPSAGMSGSSLLDSPIERPAVSISTPSHIEHMRGANGPSSEEIAEVAVRLGDRSIIGGPDAWSLVRFDRKNDPRELHPLPVLDGDPLVPIANAVVDQLTKGKDADQDEQELDSQTLEALRALGYVE